MILSESERDRSLPTGDMGKVFTINLSDRGYVRSPIAMQQLVLQVATVNKNSMPRSIPYFTRSSAANKFCFLTVQTVVSLSPCDKARTYQDDDE